MDLLEKSLLGLVIGGLAFAAPVAAAPGDHLVAGGATLVPSVGLGVEYTSNPYHAQVPDPDDGATNMKLAPSFDLSLRRRGFDLTCAGEYALRKYFPASEIALDRYDDFTLRGDLDAGKGAVVGVRLTEAVGVANYPADVETSSHPYTKQFRNQTGASLVVRPGSALELAPGAAYALDDYTTAATAQISAGEHYNTRHTWGVTGDVSWKFLQRTALVLNASWARASYTSPVVEAAGVTWHFADHDMFRVATGLRGRITQRLVVTALAGYGSAVYDEASAGGIPALAADLTGIEHLLVDATVRYSMTRDDALSVGYEKDFRDSFFTNYVAYNRGYAAVDTRFADHLGIVGEVSLAAERYRGQETREDLALGASAEVAYYVREWTSLSGRVDWQHRSSTNQAVGFDDVKFGLAATAEY